MKQNTLLIVLLFTVFFIGFLSGSFWQTMLQYRLQIADEPPIAASADIKRIGTENTNTVTPSQLTEEEQITQALTDPDFKRIHEFLIRESPMQMNLENKNK